MQKLLYAALPLLAPSLLAQGTLEAVEPNATTATATTLALGAQGYGQITPGDEDWFKITLAAPADLKVWTAPGFAGAIDDTRCRIFAADGTTVLIDVDDGNIATHGYYSTFAVGNYAAGDYYVGVRGFSATTSGSYTLDVVAAAPGTFVSPGSGPLTAVVEGAEDNDPRNLGGVATASAVDTTNSGNIHTGTLNASFNDPGADYDFYAISVAAAGDLVIETVTGSLAPALGDSVVFLTDASYNVLASDDDGGAGLLSLLTHTVAPGSYFVVVKGWGAGNYDLEISMPPSVPTGASTVTLRTGGCAGTAGTPSLATRATSSGARPEAPVLGSQFFVDGAGMPANAPLMRVIGLDPLASPFDLGAYGAPGCAIEVDPIDQSFALADGAGVDFWGLSLPSNLAFLGLTIEQQLAVLDVGANALGLSVSNRASLVCGVTH